MGLAALCGLSLLAFKSSGAFGAIVREVILALFGNGGAIVPITFLFIVGWHFLRWRKAPAFNRQLVGYLLLGFWLLTVIHFVAGADTSPVFSLTNTAGSGWFGRLIVNGLMHVFSSGSYIVLGIVLIICVILLLDRPLSTVVGEILARLRQSANGQSESDKSNRTAKPEKDAAVEQISEENREEASTNKIAPLPKKPMLKVVEPVESKDKSNEKIESIMPPGPIVSGPYELPSYELLHPAPTRTKKSGVQPNQAKQLEETLASFGIQAKVIEVHQGPVITRYELQPAPGVKVSRIVNLSNDLALALAARGLRIEAPIPGKAAIGIEVPNSESRLVTLREVLETKSFATSSKLCVALGVDIGGEPVIADLGKMPHLLVAGATGSGKSVCINSIVVSLLYKAFPNEVKLVMIDPKMVELSVYNNIPHLSSPVVTEAKKASAVLRAVVTEMENRYKAFAAKGFRDLDKYNASLPEEERLPYIVVIIDELADLMMVAPVEVEDAICRLAQMARATGIHLVVATQRPSVDVITGLIKANIPSRIAFAVSSQIDSRTILDGAGAEQLLGRGDMLFSPVGSLKPRRVQGALVTEEEIAAVTSHWKERGTPEFVEAFVNAEAKSQEIMDEEEDELFWDAVRVVVEVGHASASILQRKLRVGYSRAARLVDIMESRGLVGPHEGSKPREVLITARQMEEIRERMAERS